MFGLQPPVREHFGQDPPVRGIVIHHQHPLLPQALRIDLSLPGFAGQTLYLSYLTADGADAKHGATWNGTSYEQSGDGAPTKVDDVEHTAVNDVLHQAVTLAESKAKRGQVAVDLDVAPGLPTIEGDHHQLCQVFTNLVANAFDALDGRGRITIAARLGMLEEDPAFAQPHAPIPTVIVEVADNGPGVPPELSDRIFNPFFTTKPQGSGLGLAIVRKIVDAHDGQIDLFSSKETGTRFRVTLPVSAASSWFK